MWNSSGSSLQSVLIVENDHGEVFIVENKESKSQVDKILKKEKKTERSIRVTEEIYQDDESEFDDGAEYLDEDVVKEEYLFEETTNGVSFVDAEIEYIQEGQIETSVKREKEEQATAEVTFDGHWSSDEEALIEQEDEESVHLPEEECKELKDGKKSRQHYWKHKKNIVRGKNICKYCEIEFQTFREKTHHAPLCEFLQCDPKNFVCRICNKELSKKTFSNHLHETLACRYCGKEFVNPRNMKAHIKNQHKTEKFAPPSPKIALVEDEHNKIELMEVQVAKRPAKEKKRYECDLCGKYLASIASLNNHIRLHMGTSTYICENCGEDFYTSNGIKKHSCEKRRRRPEVDFRTYDLRFCRFCDTRFNSFDENKAHPCPYQDPEDSKSVFCRCCGKKLPKLAFNRHMEIHSGVDWVCSVCNKKISTERGLKVHMTTHTGLKPYKCKVCQETFINKVVLDRHMRFHGASTKFYRCEFCFKQLSTKTSLESHIKRLHKPTIECELCKLEFVTRDLLKNHLSVDHQPSICDICNKSFTLPRYLKMHEKLHFAESSESRVQCSICSKLLGVKNIKPHVFRHHQDQFDVWRSTNPTL